MKILFKIAFRDLINNRAFTLFFVLNLFLGLVGFAVLSAFRENVESLLITRSQEILGADLVVSARRDLSDQERDSLEKALMGTQYEMMKTVEAYSMVRSGSSKSSRLAQVKAIEPAYPFYGVVEFSQGPQKIEVMQPLQMKSLQESSSVWMDEDLAYQLKVKKGDKILIGEGEFVLDQIVVNSAKAGQSRTALAPGLYMSARSLKKAKLISFGSVATYRYSLKVLSEQKKGQASLPALLDKVEEALPDPALRVRIPAQEGEQIGRVLGYLSDYLGLAGLAALLLSGIGAGYLFQNFLLERVEQVAVLKSLGMRPASIAGIFFVQVAFLSLLATALANIVAWSALPLVGAQLQEWIELPGDLSLSWRTFIFSYMAAFGMSFFVCAPIFIKMLLSKTVNLFEGSQLFELRFTFSQYFLYAPLLLFVWVLAVLQSTSLIVGSLFTASLLCLVSVVALFFPWMFAAIDRFFLKGARPRIFSSLPLGVGIRFFARERLSSTLSICALSIGIMLLALIGQLDLALRSELQTSGAHPDFFIFDVQEEQTQPLRAWAKGEGIDLSPLAPMIQARLKKINDRPVVRESGAQDGFTTREERSNQRSRSRSVNLSYKLELSDSERIVEGKPFTGPFDPTKQDLPYVSLEKRYAGRMDVNVGDTLTYEVLGLEIKAQVRNLRTVRWTSFSPNFFILFQPGVLEDAPKTYLSSIRSQSGMSKSFERKELQWQVQDRLVEEFPNLSVINVSNLVAKALEVFDAMSKALMVMAILCMLIGIFVLFAIMQNQVAKRKYDSALQKVLGVAQTDLLKSLVYEYAAVAFCSFLVALGFTYITIKLVAHLFFDGTTAFSWIYMLGLFAIVGLAALLLILFSSRRFYAFKIKSLLD